MLSNRSQGGFEKVILICTWLGTDVIVGNFELIPLVLVCYTELKSKYVRYLSNFSYIYSLTKIRYEILILIFILFSSVKKRHC